TRIFRGDANIGHAGEVAARADRRAVHGGDDGYFDIPERERNALDAVAIIVARLRRRGLAADAFRIAVEHGFDVAAGAERIAGAGDDDHADALVAVGAFDGIDELGAMRERADRVHALRIVQCQRDDALVFFVQD